MTNTCIEQASRAYRIAMRAKSLAMVIRWAQPSLLPESSARGYRFAAILRLMRQGYSHAEASAVVDAGVAR